MLIIVCSTVLLGCTPPDNRVQDERHYLTVQVLHILNKRIEKLEKKNKVHIPASQRIHFQ